MLALLPQFVGDRCLPGAAQIMDGWAERSETSQDWPRCLPAASRPGWLGIGQSTGKPILLRHHQGVATQRLDT